MHRVWDLVILSFIIAGINFLFINIVPYWLTTIIHLMFIAYLLVEIYRAIDKEKDKNPLPIE